MGRVTGGAIIIGEEALPVDRYTERPRIGFEYNFHTGFKPLIDTVASRYRLKEAEQAYDATRQKMLLDAMTRYYTWLRDQSAVAAARQNLLEAEGQYRQNQLRVRTGLGTQYEVEQAAVQEQIERPFSIRREVRRIHHPHLHLVAAMAKKLQGYLVSKHELPADAAANLILQTRERATVSLLSRGASGADLEELVFQIHVNGRLTPTLIIRALCVGDMAFFEAAMARLSSVPMKNAKKLIHEGGDLGLRSLYEKAKMPERLFSAVRAAVQILAEEDYDGGRNDRERFVARIIERLLTQFEDPASKMTQDDIDYLMTKLRQLAA